MMWISRKKKQEYQISDDVILKNIKDLKKNYTD